MKERGRERETEREREIMVSFNNGPFCGLCVYTFIVFVSIFVVLLNYSPQQLPSQKPTDLHTRNCP